ncbi:MAG: hypothetical protein ABGW87_00670 [Sphingomonadaceae bacterium]
MHAQEVRKGIIVKVDAEADSNPFLGYSGTGSADSSSDWVGAGSVEVRPWLTSKGPTSSFNLSAFARGRAYTSKYGFDDSYGGNLNVTKRTSERTTLSANASVTSSSPRGRYDYIGRLPASLTPGGTGSDVGTPVTDPSLLVPGEDITLLGLSGRTTNINVGAQGTTQLSERSSFNANVGYQKLIVTGNSGSSFGNTDYDSVSAGLGYTHQLSQRTQIGLTGNARYTHYQAIYPSATTFGLFATLDRQLGEFWHLSASAGVSATHSEANSQFPSYSNVTAAGSVSICNQNSRRSFCLSYDRAQQPSALGRIRNTDSVSAQYSQSVSDRDRLSATAGYTSSKSNDPNTTSFRDIELLSFRSTFTHTFSDRLDGYVFGSVDRSYGGFVNDKPRIAIGIGLTVRIGDHP